MSFDKKTFGQNVFLFRQSRHWSRRQLAERLAEHLGRSFSIAAIGGWEQGVRVPKLPVIDALAAIFEIDPTELLYADQISRLQSAASSPRG